MEDVVVTCQRCGRDGGRAYQGWALLCQKCINEDNSEFWEDNRQGVKT